MKKILTAFYFLILSSTALAADLSPECSARIKHHRTSIEAAAKATYYYQSLCAVDDIKPADCGITEKDLSNADLISLAVRKVSYSKKPLTEIEAQTLLQICKLNNFDTDTIGKIIEEMP